MTDLTTSGISGSPESMSRPVPRFLQELLLAVGLKSLRVRTSARTELVAVDGRAVKRILCSGDRRRGYRRHQAAGIAPSMR